MHPVLQNPERVIRRHLRKVMLIGGLSSAVLGCGSDDSTGPQAQDVVGTWHATKVQVTSVANGANTIDIVAAGGTLQVVLNANHTFSSTVTFPGEAPETSTGTYTQTATTLSLINDQNSGGDVIVFDVALSNGTLLLTNGTITFDFGSGEVASKLDLTLVH
jgi:hypothetical protein